jgi:F-type H+-transporting ATPase subunit gamma
MMKIVNSYYNMQKKHFNHLRLKKMSETLESLGRKIYGADELKSVVRTMKVLAASNIIQYEKAVSSLSEYYNTVEMGLFVCLRNMEETSVVEKVYQSENEIINVVAFGSDQGLVGQFNDVLSEFIYKTLEKFHGLKKIRAVGERIQGRLEDIGLPPEGVYEVPNSVTTITPLIGQILLQYEIKEASDEIPQLFLFYNRPKQGSIYEPVVQHLLPLEDEWHNNVAKIKWPTKNIPEAMFGVKPTLHGLIRNYLFVSLYRACAESLASENASRLAAMQRAEKNIDELLEDLNRSFNRLRQSTIDEELFDLISGSEALSKVK